MQHTHCWIEVAQGVAAAISIIVALARAVAWLVRRLRKSVGRHTTDYMERVFRVSNDGASDFAIAGATVRWALERDGLYWWFRQSGLRRRLWPRWPRPLVYEHPITPKRLQPNETYDFAVCAYEVMLRRHFAPALQAIVRGKLAEPPCLTDYARMRLTVAFESLDGRTIVRREEETSWFKWPHDDKEPGAVEAA